MNEPRACDRSAGSLISSGPSSLGALINLARERRQMPVRAVGRVRRWLLKNLPRHTQKEQAGDDSRFLCMRGDARWLLRRTCNMQPPAAEYLNTAGILRGIKIYLLPASLRPFSTAYKHARFFVPKAAQVLIYKRVS